MNVKKICCGEKSNSVFLGFKGGPFKHTKTFFLQNVFYNIYENAFATNSRCFHKKYTK